MSIVFGLFFFGICVGFLSEEWHCNVKSGMNYRLGISRQIIGQFGETQDVVDAIDINKDDFERVSQQAKMLKGKPVYIQVIASSHAGGRSGAFLKLRAPKGSNLFPFNADAFASKNSAVQPAKVG